MYTTNYWGGSNQPRKAYDQNWLTDFSQQAKNKMGTYDIYGNGSSQNALANSAYAQQPQATNQQSYQPEASLMSRYKQDMNGVISGAGQSLINQSPIANATNQLAAYMQPAEGNSAQEDDYNSFTDEAGDEYKIKKQPKPAYDWSQDFG